MKATQEAVYLFGNGLNCSQAILTAFGGPYGIDPENAKKLGRPWGGGLGRSGQICGSLTGAIALLGYTQNQTLDEEEARNEICGHVQELIRRFEERNGTSLCRELLGADFATSEGRKIIKEAGLVKKLCPKFVEDTGSILAGILKD